MFTNFGQRGYFYGMDYTYQEEEDLIQTDNYRFSCFDAVFIKRDLTTAQKMIAFCFLYNLETAQIIL